MATKVKVSAKKFATVKTVKQKLVTPITVWYSVQNGGDGSAYPRWFLTQEETEFDQENMYEGWGETCNGSVETYVGSDIHKAAVINSKEMAADIAAGTYNS